MPLPFFLVPFLLVACSAPDSNLHADATKLRPWSVDLQSEQPLPPPFVADFESGARALCYAAVDESGEESGPSLDLVKQVMDNRKYGVVVLEGIPRSLGLNPALPATSADSEGGSGYYLHEETSAAMARAVAKKIPFVGAEPDEAEIKNAVVGAGYTVQDLFGLYVLRLVPQWRLDGTLSRRSFEKVYASASHGIGARLGLAAREVPTVAQFQKWFQAKHGTPFQLRDVKPEITEPTADGALLSQRVASVTDRVRSQHILHVTEEMLNRYGRVLLVFHGQLYAVQEPALESMLGKPIRISDQP